MHQQPFYTSWLLLKLKQFKINNLKPDSFQAERSSSVASGVLSETPATTFILSFI
jgi:hypothetical protein